MEKRKMKFFLYLGHSLPTCFWGAVVINFLVSYCLGQGLETKPPRKQELNKSRPFYKKMVPSGPTVVGGIKKKLLECWRRGT